MVKIIIEVTDYGTDKKASADTSRALLQLADIFAVRSAASAPVEETPVKAPPTTARIAPPVEAPPVEAPPVKAPPTKARKAPPTTARIAPPVEAPVEETPVKAPPVKAQPAGAQEALDDLSDEALVALAQAYMRVHGNPAIVAAILGAGGKGPNGPSIKHIPQANRQAFMELISQ